MRGTAGRSLDQASPWGRRRAIWQCCVCWREELSFSTGSATYLGRDWWMDRVDECGTGGSILPFSLPVPDPSGLVTSGAFGGPVAAQAEFTGADGKCQLEVFFENLTHVRTFCPHPAVQLLGHSSCPCYPKHPKALQPGMLSPTPGALAPLSVAWPPGWQWHSPTSRSALVLQPSPPTHPAQGLPRSSQILTGERLWGWGGEKKR